MHSLLQRRRIRRGVALLDEKHGPEWPQKVNTETLDINLFGRCVLGQLHGSYADGLDQTDLVTNAQAEKHGFYDSRNRYEDLNKLWIKRIKKEQLARSA